jgi:hypothetical protein
LAKVILDMMQAQVTEFAIFVSIFSLAPWLEGTCAELDGFPSNPRQIPRPAEVRRVFGMTSVNKKL